MSDDSQLLRAWRDGDRTAGDRLLRRHFSSLHRFFASKVGDEAEDLIQNTLLACVKYVDKLAQASSFKAYLFSIASNQLYGHLRRNAREGALIDFTQKSAVALGLSPSAVAAKRQRDQQLSAALMRLPFELQLVLELGYWEDLNASEIAEILDIPPGTAKSKIRRAKQLLAKELERVTRRPLAPAEDHADVDARDEDAGLGAWVRQVRDTIAESGG